MQESAAHTASQSHITGTSYGLPFSVDRNLRSVESGLPHKRLISHETRIAGFGAFCVVDRGFLMLAYGVSA